MARPTRELSSIRAVPSRAGLPAEGVLFVVIVALFRGLIEPRYIPKLLDQNGQASQFSCRPRISPYKGCRLRPSYFPMALSCLTPAVIPEGRAERMLLRSQFCPSLLNAFDSPGRRTADRRDSGTYRACSGRAGTKPLGRLTAVRTGSA